MSTVLIDAGHGGVDPGAVNDDRYEKDDALNFSLALKKALERLGFNVKTTRTNDKTVSLTQRSDLSNTLRPDYFVSIHRNSSTNPNSNGVENWVYTNPSQTSVELAENIQDALVDVGVQTDRGIKKGNYHVLRETNAPSVLVELGFISNDRDNALFDRNFDSYVEAVAKGIAETDGVRYNPPSTMPPIFDDDDDRIYRVQVGAFRQRQNAEALLRELKSKGYNPVIMYSD